MRRECFVRRPALAAPMVCDLSVAALVLLLLAGTAAAQSSPENPYPAGRLLPGIEAPADGGSCTADCGCCCNPVCGPPGRIWADVDYLLWWVKGDRLPPLVTTGPEGSPRSQAGVLGAPGTAVLFGGDTVNGDLRSGARITAGFWLDCEQTVGIEFNNFFLESKSTGGEFTSTGNPILARPFFNGLSNAPDTELVAFPGVVSGTVRVSDTSSGIDGQELLGRLNLCCSCCCRLDLLAGWRRLHYSDHLTISESLTPESGPVTGVPPGTSIVLNDTFDTSNTFNGFDLGIAGECRCDRLALGFLAKVALGYNDQSVDILGSTVVTEPGMTPVVNPGGLLALESNIGHYHRDRFMAVPEFGVNASYQLTDHLRARIGYTFLYWPEVFRAADQIDFAVNPNLIPPAAATGPQRPAPLLHDTDLWVQGINLGFEFRY
jgi:Putative beta barrel porin-7 (BBP7)